MFVAFAVKATNIYKRTHCIGLYSFVSVGVVLVWFSVGGMGRASWARLLGTLNILALKGYLLKGYLSGHWRSGPADLLDRPALLRHGTVGPPADRTAHLGCVRKPLLLWASETPGVPPIPP